jgi:hypothetical protein
MPQNLTVTVRPSNVARFVDWPVFTSMPRFLSTFDPCAGRTVIVAYLIVCAIFGTTGID